MEKPQAPKFELNFGFILLLFLFIAGILWYQYHASKAKLTKKYKSVLIEKYGVDKKTFAKWVEFFCADIIEIEKYKAQRKISQWDMDLIVDRLGEPTAKIGVMNKEQLAELTGSDYAMIRISVLANIEASGLTVEQFDAMSIFLPTFALKIAEIMGDTGERYTPNYADLN